MSVTMQQARLFAHVWIELPQTAQSTLLQLGKEYHGTRRSRKEEFIERIKEEYIERIVDATTSANVETADVSCVSIDSILLELGARATGDNESTLESHRKYVGRRIETARTRRNMSQLQLAQRSGIHQSYISRIESGQFCATYKTIARIAQGLGVPIYELDPSFDDIGERIRSIRTSNNLSLSKLATESGLSIEQLDSIECGTGRISRHIVQSIANALGVRETEIDPGFSLSRLKS